MLNWVRHKSHAGAALFIGHPGTWYPTKWRPSAMMEARLGQVPLGSELPLTHRVSLDFRHKSESPRG